MHKSRHELRVFRILVAFTCAVLVQIVSSMSFAVEIQTTTDNFDQDLEFAFGGEDYISIATGYNQPLSEAPAIATVLTAQDLRQRGATSLREALEMIPGLHNTTSAISNSNEMYAIRGLHSKHNPHVLLLINGLPQTSMLFGNRGQAWGGMPLENIDRIEVVRGPGSAVFGADAFAGTINIVTKKPSEINQTELGIRLGQFQTQDAWLVTPGKWRHFDVATYIQVHRNNGYDGEIDSDAQTVLDNANSTNASLAPGQVNYQAKSLDMAVHAQSDHLDLRASYMGRRDLGTGPGVAEALDPKGYSSSDRFEVSSVYLRDDLIEDSEIRVTASAMELNNQLNLVLYPPGAFENNYPGGFPDGLIGNPGYWERHYRGEGSLIYTGLPHHLFRVGGGMHYANQYRVKESKNFYADGSPAGAIIDFSDTANVYTHEVSRKVFYGFVQDEWEFSADWKATLGLRADHYSDFGATINPRAALVWSITRTTNLKLLHGTAFRPPSFAELYNQANPLSLGNENLSPEKIATTEFGIDFHPSSNQSLTVSVFHYEVVDAIQFVQDTGKSSHTAQNIGRYDANGFELEGKIKIAAPLSLIYNYAYQSAIDMKTDHPIGFAPTHQSYIAANWEVTRQWSLVPQLHSVIGRKRPNGDNRPDIADYHSFDIKLSYAPINSTELGFIGKNLFDADAREPSASTGDIKNDIPQPGRYLAIEFRTNW